MNSGTLTGAGFTVSGATFPATLNPGQTVHTHGAVRSGCHGSGDRAATLQSDSSTNSTAIVKSERHGHGSGKSAIDDQSGENSGVWQRDGEHGLDAAGDVDLDGDGACR